MSGGHPQQQHPNAVQTFPMPSGPRPSSLVGQTGFDPTNPSGNSQNADKLMESIKAVMASPQARDLSSRSMSPLSTGSPLPDQSQFSTALPASLNRQNIQPPNSNGVANMALQGAQNGIGRGLTSGLGAGDAAAQAAQASGANLPGAASAQAVAGIQGGMSEMMRAAIQKKLDLLEQIAKGG